MWTLYERHTCRSRYNGLISEHTRLQGALAVKREHEPHAAMLLRASTHLLGLQSSVQLRSKNVSRPWSWSPQTAITQTTFWDARTADPRATPLL